MALDKVLPSYPAARHEAFDLDEPVTEEAGEDLDQTHDGQPNEAGLGVLLEVQVDGPQVHPSRIENEKRENVAVQEDVPLVVEGRLLDLFAQIVVHRP